MVPEKKKHTKKINDRITRVSPVYYDSRVLDERRGLLRSTDGSGR